MEEHAAQLAYAVWPPSQLNSRAMPAQLVLHASSANSRLLCSASEGVYACTLVLQAAVLAAAKHLSIEQMEGLRHLFESFDTDGEFTCKIVC